jgi:hypothetical protein
MNESFMTSDAVNDSFMTSGRAIAADSKLDVALAR